MKNLLITILTCLSFGCNSSRQAIQNTAKVEKSSLQQSESEKKDLISSTKQPTKENVITSTKDDQNIEDATEQVTESKINSKENGTINKNPKVTQTKKSSKTISHYTWNNLLKKHVSKEGNVNYKGFKEDIKIFETYLYELRNYMPKEHWTRKDKLAYWLNAYNAYTVKLIVDKYPIKSIKDIKDPWDYRFFKLGQKWYTLNDIEHKILRKMGDPRIHFGINCASFSCPPLPNKAFTPQNVNQELEKLTIAFVNDPKRNSISASKIEISKIFSWFSKDFKTNGSLIDFLNTYSKVTIQKNAKKSFMDYDWNLNE